MKLGSKMKMSVREVPLISSAVRLFNKCVQSKLFVVVGSGNRFIGRMFHCPGVAALLGGAFLESVITNKTGKPFLG